MSDKVSTAVLDAALAHITGNVTAIHLCSSEPTDRADAISKSLATASIGSGDFTALADVSQGRRLRLASGYSLGNASAGDASPDLHYALISGSDLLAVADEPGNQGITVSNPVQAGQIDFTFTYTL